MPNNITINIKNCGCCGDGSAGSSETVPVPDLQYDDLGDPADPAGPPEGYSDPSTSITDRQCKMSVWLYSWVEAIINNLANSIAGNAVLSVIAFAATSAFLAPILPTLVLLVSTALSAILTGPDPSDIVVGLIARAIIVSIIAAFAGVETSNITVPLVQDLLSVFQAAKDDIICALSKAENAADAKLRLDKAVGQLELSVVQRAIVYAFTPNMFFTMLFFSADWWPSFDDDELSVITTTCCGSYTDGAPIVAGSVEQCQASYYIIDQLIATFEETGSLISYSMSPNPFDDDKTAIYNRLESGLDIPLKVQELSDYPAYLIAVAEIIYSYWPFNVFSLPDFTALAAYMTTNKATLLSNIQAAVDQDSAYSVLSTFLTVWIDANVSDTTHQLQMKKALDALIKPDDNRADLMDLLFIQDSDLLSYNLAGCSPCQHTILGTIDPSPGVQTWQSAVSANGNEISLGYCCNGTAMLDVTFDSISGWTDRGAGYIDFRLFSICDNFPTNGDIYDNTNTFPTGQRYCFKTLVFWSSTPFSIGVTVHGEC